MGSEKFHLWNYIYLGNTLWAANNLIEAEKSFSKAIKVSSKDGVGYWCLAFFYERQGKSNDAKKYYRKGVDLSPDDIEANLRFGIFLKQSGELEKAKAYLDRVISIDPNNKQAKLALDDIK